MTNANPYQANRIAGLRRFAIAITLLNILGHTVLGFEQSWAQPLVALATGYTVEITLETVDAIVHKSKPKYWGSVENCVNFLLSAHISSLAVAMLLYANETLWPISFAVAVAIGSKAIFRMRNNQGERHFLNPSNFGISSALILFSWIGIAPPYQFTENLHGWQDWILPVIIICSGTFLNARFTHKLPLIAGWVGGFFLQAVLRTYILGSPLIPCLLPMTGVAFLLFTFYMVSDPGTTPAKPVDQVIFGASVAFAYSLLTIFHIVFGMFFGLTLVCVLRGLILVTKSWQEKLTQKVLIPVATEA